VQWGHRRGKIAVQWGHRRGKIAVQWGHQRTLVKKCFMPFTPLGIYDIALKADTLQNMYLLGGNINNNLSSLKAFFYNILG
jgi:hypothetical protein